MKRKLFIILAVIIFCGVADAELTPNPDSFERPFEDILCITSPCPDGWSGWESWGSGSGTGGWSGSNGWPEIIVGDGTHGTQCLETRVPASLDWWGYVQAFNPGNPIVPGGFYRYFFDYKSVGSGSGIFKLEFYDAFNNQLSVTAWDPYPIETPDVWQHFSHTFRAPDYAEFVTVVVGATGIGSTIRYDMVGLQPAVFLPADCPYELEGDEDGNCRVTINDLALMFDNWLIDCIDDPTNPACARYTITDLGDVVALAINDHGQIAGTFEAQQLIQHAFLYDGWGITDIGALAPDATSSSWDINNSGQVVGEVWPSVDPPYAFLYDGAEMTINGPIDQASRAINDSGQVPWDLGCTFPANGINNSGQVVGTRNGTAYLYENGTVTGLVTLGGVSSVARDINNNGLITGYDTIDFSGTYRTRAFLYDNGAVTALGTLGGDDSTHYPTSINDNGLIVGYVHFDGGDSSPFIYDGEMIDLNNLISPTSGWDLTFANDINSLGQIVGRGYIDGKFHSYLLTPVPEPGTPCTYQLVGDLDESCRVDLGDVAKLAANWLLDCIDDPADPACVTP